MAPSWCKHFDKLINRPQMLPPGTEFFCQVVEKMTLLKHIDFH